MKDQDFDLFVSQRWPAGTPRDCTALGPDLLDCVDRQEASPCPSCAKWSGLIAEWEEHLATQRNTDAALALLRSEAELMGLPLTPEQERQADLGSLLDAAHEEVHRLLSL